MGIRVRITPQKAAAPAEEARRDGSAATGAKAARSLLWSTVLLLPMIVDGTKYSAITKCKSTWFTFFFMLSAAILIVLLATADHSARKGGRTLRDELTEAPAAADAALLAYWLLMVISCITGYDTHQAIVGLDPRNNGLLYQTMYVASYFILSRGLGLCAGEKLGVRRFGADEMPKTAAKSSVKTGVKSSAKPGAKSAKQPAAEGNEPKRVPNVITVLRRVFGGRLGANGFEAPLDACVFTWGGVLLAGASVFHFFGVDLYNISKVNGAAYAGPFWTTTKYRFLGPVGNVNLGSYILAVAAVITAGLYVNRIVRKWDRHGLFTLAAFAVILYAELNINTDAGVVALAVAAVALPAVLGASLGHLNRLLHVYGTAAAVILFNNCLVEVTLRRNEFGSTELLLTAACVLLAVASGAGLARYLACKAEEKRELRSSVVRIVGKRARNFRMSAKKGSALTHSWRGTRKTAVERLVLLVGAVTGLLTAAGVMTVALWMTSPKNRPLGGSTPVHTLGSLLRGGLGWLYAVLLLLAVTAAVTLFVWLWSRARFNIRGKTIRGLCIAAALLAIVGGLALAYVITEPDPTPAGSIATAVKVTDKADLKEKSDGMVMELGQMLRGNFSDKFGHNRLFTWKRTLRLVKLNPVFGIGPDNFKQFFAIYFHDEAVKMFPSSNGSLDKAHNEFLDVLISNGVAGLLAYLAFFGALLWYSFRRDTRGRLAPVFGVAVLAYMAHAFFGYQLPIQSPLMWVMIGTAAACIRAEEKVFGKTARR